MTSVAQHKVNGKPQNTGFLNEIAPQAYGLSKEWSSLRTRLLRLRGFAQRYPEILYDKEDAVYQISNLFSMGTPLWYIFDQLPLQKESTGLETEPLTKRRLDPNFDRIATHPIAVFAMKLRETIVLENTPNFEKIDMRDRNLIDSLVKAVNVAADILDYLPEKAFVEPSIDKNGEDTYQHNTGIRKMLETERTYVQDLETLQALSSTFSKTNFIDDDTTRLMFPNLEEMISFHRRFLNRIENTAVLPFKFQRWGQHFLKDNEGFTIYESYYDSYSNASELILVNEKILSPLDNIKSVLHGLLLRPLQRIYQYPLLLESLIKEFKSTAYDHLDELVLGFEAAKGIIKNMRKALQRNKDTVMMLRDRILDWADFRLEDFGDLILHGNVVARSHINQSYIPFLFEKTMVFCQEGRQRRRLYESKSLSTMGSSNIPLILDFCVFVQNIVSVNEVPVSSDVKDDPDRCFPNPLVLTWISEGSVCSKHITIQCMRKEQMQQWRAVITRLMLQSSGNLGRASESGRSVYRSIDPVVHSNNSVLPNSRYLTVSATVPDSNTSFSDDANPIEETPLPPCSPIDENRSQRSRSSSHSSSEDSRYSLVSNATIGPKSQYVDNGDVDATHQDPDDLFLSDEDDLEEYPPPSYPVSGRETPMDRRRLLKSRSLPSICNSSARHAILVPIQLITEKRGPTKTKLPQGRSNSLPTSVSPPISIKFSDREPSPTLASRPSLFSTARNTVAKSQRSAGTTSSNVKIKVYFQDMVLVFFVPHLIERDKLIWTIELLIGIQCEPRVVEQPLRVEYKDGNGNLMPLNTTEDVRLAFVRRGPEKRSPVRLFAT